MLYIVGIFLIILICFLRVSLAFTYRWFFPLASERKKSIYSVFKPRDHNNEFCSWDKVWIFLHTFLSLIIIVVVVLGRCIIFRNFTNNQKICSGTYAAFTYGTLLNRCGIKTSTNRRAPNDGTRHCIFSSVEVIFL